MKIWRVHLFQTFRTAQRQCPRVSLSNKLCRIDKCIWLRRNVSQFSVSNHSKPMSFLCSTSSQYPTLLKGSTNSARKELWGSLLRVCPFHLNSVHFQSYSSSPGEVRELDDISYHKIADETLDELAAFFEDLGDSGLCSKDYDTSLASGVLTVNFGNSIGTYVINKQSPNKQIWLSSPKSGPKRYDIIDGQWRYSHDSVALHDLLTNEISEILGTQVDFNELLHSHISTDGDNWA